MSYLGKYPLDWPADWPRTPPAKRRRPSFRTSFANVMTDLQSEIRRLDGVRLVISTNLPLRRDGLISLASDAYLVDPGASVWFERGPRRHVIAADHYDTVAANLRGIGLTVEAMRAMTRHGTSHLLERTLHAFEALPPPRSCWDVLGLKPDATVEQVKRAFINLAVTHHPDTGGSHAGMASLTAARDEAIKIITGRESLR